MTKMNYFIAVAVCSTLTLSLPSLAIPGFSGLTLGGQVGYAHDEYNMKAFFDKEYSNNQTVGRIYAGYQFTPFMGLETGFSMISEAKLPRDLGEVSTANWDLLLNVGLPLGGTGFRFDLKGGAAYVVSNFDASDAAKHHHNFEDDSRGEFKPEIGASLSFNLNEYVAIDATYLHIYDDPRSNRLNTPCTDLALVGLRLIFSIL